MSQQQLSTVQRLAIWHAHNKKCAYTREPLLYSDLEIDHIIPEHLKNKENELQDVIKKYRLPSDFSIFSYKNLLPVHSRVNSQKSGSLFTDDNSRYYLEIAILKSEKVKELEEQFLKKIKSSDVLSALNVALEEGWVSNTEVIDYLQSITSKDNHLELLYKLDFIEQTFQGSIEVGSVKDLLNLTVKHGDHFENGLELTGPAGKIRVFSCKEFFEAKKKGFYAYTTYDMKMESFFNRTCDMLQAIMHARSPQKSYIKSPRIGITDLSKLSVSLIDTISPEQRDLIETDGKRGQSFQDWLDEGYIKIIATTSLSIHIQYRSWNEGNEYAAGQILKELLRADFNNDGVEDILVSSAFYSIGGTFGYGITKLISILNQDELFQEIRCPWQIEYIEGNETVGVDD